MIGAVEGQTIASLLAPGGAVAQVFEGFEARSGQLVMAEAVQAALDDEGSVLIEAPCGIGKSLTYLLGAALAAQDGKKTLVVTANIALQEQLIRKDIPLVQRAFPKLTYALAKGINNYFCPRNFQKGQDEGLIAKLDRREREQWHDLEDQWLGIDRDERWGGDLSDLDYELLPSVKSWATTTSDDCPGRKCRMAGECPARAAKKRWHVSDVVVTNYHLFFIDMAMGHGILPDWDFLVLDEAHKIGDIAREFFGRRASRGSVRACVNLLDFAPKQKEAVEKAGRQFFLEVEAARRRPDYKARLKNNDMIPAAGKLAAALDKAADLLGKAGNVELDSEARHKLLSAERRCREHALFVLAANHPRQHENEVFYIEGEEDRGVLKSKLIDVCDRLRAEVWSKGKATVACSATMTAGGEWWPTLKDLGAEDCSTCAVESPFDFSRCTLVLPKMPDPQSQDFHYAVADTFVEVVRAVRGRTLGLFTSYRSMNNALDALTRSNLGYPIFAQGQAPRTELVKLFKEQENSVLLGCESFWAGVDVPGPALSCVVIDRLPFATPDDPVLDAVAQRDPRGWFMRWSVPRACIQFSQGFGRLIRTKTDSGAVVVLDNRVTEKPYGRMFLRALPKGLRVSTSVGGFDF